MLVSLMVFSMLKKQLLHDVLYFVNNKHTRITLEVDENNKFYFYQNQEIIVLNSIDEAWNSVRELESKGIFYYTLSSSPSRKRYRQYATKDIDELYFAFQTKYVYEKNIMPILKKFFNVVR